MTGWGTEPSLLLTEVEMGSKGGEEDDDDLQTDSSFAQALRLQQLRAQRVENQQRPYTAGGKSKFKRSASGSAYAKAAYKPVVRLHSKITPVATTKAERENMRRLRTTAMYMTPPPPSPGQRPSDLTTEHEEMTQDDEEQL